MRRLILSVLAPALLAYAVGLAIGVALSPDGLGIALFSGWRDAAKFASIPATIVFGSRLIAIRSNSNSNSSKSNDEFDE